MLASKYWLILAGTILTIAVVTCSNIGATRQEITLDDDGGFINVLVAIHDDVAEDRSILSALEVSFEKNMNIHIYP